MKDTHQGPTAGMAEEEPTMAEGEAAMAEEEEAKIEEDRAEAGEEAGAEEEGQEEGNGAGDLSVDPQGEPDDMGGGEEAGDVKNADEEGEAGLCMLVISFFHVDVDVALRRVCIHHTFIVIPTRCFECCDRPARRGPRASCRRGQRSWRRC